MLLRLPPRTTQHWSSKTHVACEQPNAAVMPEKRRKLWHLTSTPIHKNRAAHKMLRQRSSQEALLSVSFTSCHIGSPICRSTYFVGIHLFQIQDIYPEIWNWKKRIFGSCPHPCFSLPLPAALSGISRTGCQVEHTDRWRILHLPARGKKLGTGGGNYRRYLAIYGGRLRR